MNARGPPPPPKLSKSVQTYYPSNVYGYRLTIAYNGIMEPSPHYVMKIVRSKNIYNT